MTATFPEPNRRAWYEAVRAINRLACEMFGQNATAVTLHLADDVTAHLPFPKVWVPEMIEVVPQMCAPAPPRPAKPVTPVKPAPIRTEEGRTQ